MHNIEEKHIFELSPIKYNFCKNYEKSVCFKYIEYINTMNTHSRKEFKNKLHKNLHIKYTQCCEILNANNIENSKKICDVLYNNNK